MADAVPVELDATKQTGAVVQYHHALGARVPPGKSIEHLGEDTLVYLVGKHVAAFQYETPEHRFILKNSRTAEIVTFCVSSNRKYVALAERMLDGALQVNIYTQHTGSKVRSLEFKYLSKLPVVSMDFSTDNKYLVTVTALPDVYVYLWQVDKSRLVGMVDVPFELTKATISPWAYWSMCTTGPSSLRLWRLVDKQLKATDPMPKRKDGTQGQGHRFTCHCWYDEEKLVAATEEGDIVVVENGEARKTLRGVHGEGYGIATIVSVARGFICGGEGGIISMFERTFDDSTFFRHVRRFNAPHSSRVVDISVSPKEENAVVLFRNNAMSLMSLENVELLREEASATTFQPLSVGFHDDSVTCVDVCVQKAIVVTGSLDRTIRVWNFLRRRVEFSKTFDEEVLSLALHPTGLRIVIGFKSYMRMYNVLAQDLHMCSEFPVKPCYEVRFSQGGQFFAAVVAHRVLVFNTYDFQCIAQLSGHTVMIRSICWSRNDQYITSADLNGVIYSWQLDGQKRIDTDDVRKNVSYNCIKYDDATNTVAAVGTCRVAEGGVAEGEITVRCLVPDQEPRIVRPGVVTAKLPSQRKQHTCEMALSTLAQTLFVGTPDGVLLLYHFPMLEDAQPYQRYEVHSGEIAFVMLTTDERFLFTVGEDRAMFMFEVEAMTEGRTVTRKPFNYATFDDVCYVLQSDVEDRARELATMQQDLEDLMVSKARDEANLLQKFEQERVTKDEESTAQVEFLRRQLDQATKQKADAEQALSENARQLESMHLKAAEELEALYTKRTEEANSRFQQLRTERDDLIVRYENKLFKLQKEQESEKKRLEERARDVEVKLGTEIENLKRKLVEEKQLQDAMLDQTITDYETMIDDVNAKHKQVLTRREEELSKAISSSSTGERDSDRLRKEKQVLLDELGERDKQIVDLEALMEKRRKEIESLRKEMQVRFESISTAEKKIQQLKKQTTELEKLRYVLTFKFNELKKEVAPKDKQITFMTQRVEEMDHELEKVALDREQLKQALDHKDDKLVVLQREIGSQRRAIEDKERVISTMLRELTELISTGETKRLVYDLKDVIMRFNNKSQREAAVVEEDKTAEFERQREYMEAQLACVKRQNRQKESNLRLENQRNTSENATLVKEINELRHEKKLLQNKCQVVESQLKEARLALQRATSITPQVPHHGGGGASSANAASPLAGDSTSGPTHDAPLAGGPMAGPLRSRGRLIRGPTRALRDIAQLDSDKIARIITQVERNNAEMERQQEEISRLREFVSHLLSRAEGAASADLSAAERERHAEIKKHLQTTMTPAPGLP